MPKNLQVSNYGSDGPICQFTYAANGSVVLTVTNLRTSGAIQPSQYGLQFTGLTNGDSARSAILNGDPTTGAFATLYAGSTVSEVIYTNDFDFQYLFSNGNTTLLGNPSQNNIVSNLTVSFIVNYKIPTNGTFTIGLPYQNNQFFVLGAQTAVSMIANQTALIATGSYSVSNYFVNLMQTQANTTNLGLLNYFIDQQSQTTYIKIFLNNIFNINPNSNITVILQGIKMPPTLDPLTGFEITTGDQDFYEIEKDIYATLTNKIPGNDTTSISQSFAEILTSNFVLDQGQTYQFTIFTTGDLPMNSYFTLQIPSAVGIPSNPATQIMIECIAGCQQQNLTLSWSQQSRTLSFLNLYSDVSSYLASPGPIKFKIIGLTNPISIKPAYFLWSSFAKLPEGDFIIDQISQIFVTAVQGSCQMSYFAPTDGNYQIYGLASSWSISFQCQHQISPDNSIQIILPQDFYITQPNCNQGTGQNCTAINQTITITNFTKGIIQSQTVFNLTIDSIRNPPNLNNNYTITFQTLYSTGDVVDYGNYSLNNVFTPGIVTNFTVNPQTYAYGQFPVLYDFVVVPSGDIWKGAYIVITLPDEVSINDQQIFTLNCVSNTTGFVDQKIACSCSGNQITIMNGFSSGPTQAMKQQQKSPILKFTLPQFRNPRSQYSGTFNVQIFSQNNRLIYFWNNTNPTINSMQSQSIQQGPIIQMNTYSQPISTNLFRDSVQNGNLTNYTFQITPTNLILPLDILIIQLPYPVVFSQNSTCLNCTVSNDYKSISYTFQNLISSSQQFSLNVSNIQNPPSTQPTGQSVIISILSSGTLIEQLSQGLTITNTIPGQISSVEIVPIVFEADKVTNYTVMFQPVNYQQDMIIVLTVPTQIWFNPAQLNCYGIVGTDSQNVSCSTNTLKNQITISNAFTFQSKMPSQVKIIIDSFKNPSQGVISKSFKLQTFNKFGFILDEVSQGLVVNFFCQFPCKTCDLNNNTICMSCYDGDTNQIFYQNQCINTCPDGFTNTTKNNCTQCVSPCALCISVDKCSTCTPGYRLQDQVCVEIVYWPFPWIALSIFWFTLILLSECVTKGESRFKEAFISMLSFSELGSWGTFTGFCIHRTGFGYESIGGIIACSIYLLLNWVHAIVHVKKIIPQSQKSYQTMLSSYKCSTAFIRLIAYCFTFKFSLILISWCFLSPIFKGDYNYQNTRQFNIFSLISITIPYPLIMVTCLYFLYQDSIWSYAGFAAIEVVTISTLMSSLLFVDAVKVISCAKKVKIAPGKTKVMSNVDLDYESEDEDASKKMIKRNRPQVNEFGDFNEEDQTQSRLQPFVTNQSLSIDEHQLLKVNELVKQIQDNQEQFMLERQQQMQTQKEQLQIIQQLMAAPSTDHEDVFRYVDDKINHSDELNRQILREIYEDQLQHIKLQAKKGYRDLEQEMENIGDQVYSDSDPESIVKDTANIPMPEIGTISFYIKSNEQLEMLQQVTPKAARVMSEVNSVSNYEIMIDQQPVYELYENKAPVNQSQNCLVIPKAHYDTQSNQLQGDDILYQPIPDAQMELNSNQTVSQSQLFYNNDDNTCNGNIKLSMSNQNSVVIFTALMPEYEVISEQVVIEGSERQFIIPEQSQVELKSEEIQLLEVLSSKSSNQQQEQILQVNEELLDVRKSDQVQQITEMFNLEDESNDGVDNKNIAQDDDVIVDYYQDQTEEFQIATDNLDQTQNLDMNQLDIGYLTEVSQDKQKKSNEVQISESGTKSEVKQVTPDVVSSQTELIQSLHQSQSNTKIVCTDIDSIKSNQQLKSAKENQVGIEPSENNLIDKQISEELILTKQHSEINFVNDNVIASELPLEQSPQISKETVTQQPLEVTETVGLKLVDLGLGDKIKSSQIKKKAVDWYLQRESQIISRSPSKGQSTPLNKSKSPQINSRGETTPVRNQIKISPNRNSKTNLTPKLKSPHLMFVQDEYGHSESSEGIVNHEFFSVAKHLHYVDTGSTKSNAPGQLMQNDIMSDLPYLQRKQQKFKSAAELPKLVQKMQILYSDRSESSIDVLMEDTPSNYNIPNGRLEGQSLGIKSMHTKHDKTKTLDFVNRNEGQWKLSQNYNNKNVETIAEESGLDDRMTIKQKKILIKSKKAFKEQNPEYYNMSGAIAATQIQNNNFV